MNNSSKQHILLTGGSGLIGGLLTEQLLEKGYRVSHLGRSPGKNTRVKTYLWNIDKNAVDEQCIDGVDIIIHLAGAGIAEKRWTRKRKKLLIDSRTQSIKILYRLLKNKPNRVSTIISASGVGYYSNRGEELLTEESEPAHDFLGICCVEWEKAVDEGEILGLKIIKLRTGVVLTDKGGALPKLALPIRLRTGSPLGSGKQWVPWIHWQDAVDIYINAIENNQWKGVYNMVSPFPVTNQQLTQAIAEQLQKFLWLPRVPAFILRFLLGEMSLVVLGSTKVSAEKIEATGFIFKYPEITSALKEIYGKKTADLSILVQA